MQEHSDAPDSGTSPRGRTQCLIRLPKLPRITCQGRLPRDDEESSSLTERLLPTAAHTTQVVRPPTANLPWTTVDACGKPVLESPISHKPKLTPSDIRTGFFVKSSRGQNTNMPAAKEQRSAETLTPSDLEGAADMRVTKGNSLNPQRLFCLQMCCARLSCSWFCKIFILVLAVNMYFLVGSLSQPLWLPISLHKACQTSDDGGGSPKPFLAKPAMAHGLRACQSLCNSIEGCQAVDWFNETKWCNLYTDPCAQPTAEYSGSSSYQMAISCSLRNGSSGVLLGGHCNVDIQVPTAWSIVRQEVPVMLSSPRSWAISLGVTLLYTYIVSAWCRQKLQPVSFVALAPIRLCYRWFLAGGCWRRFVLALILIGVWFSYTWWEWGPPPIWASAEGQRMMKLPLAEWAWLGGSSLVLTMALFPGVRSLILSIILGIGAWIMTAFTGLMTFALSACFDVGALGAAGLAAGSGEAMVIADGAAALDGVAVADVTAGAEGAVAADATAAAGATAEASAAADAAVAAEAAAAAEAVSAAEGAATIAVLCSIQ